MYADPQSLNLGGTPGAWTGGTATSVPRTAVNGSSSIYTSADGKQSLSISHQYGKRTRRLARVDFNKIVPDPLSTVTNVTATGSVYVVLDMPPDALFTSTELKNELLALLQFFTTSTNADKFIAGES